MNELDEFNYINDLYDLYRSLLTDKQIIVMDNYYKYNLSLSEISINLKITRSAVQDTLSHSKEKLREFEEKIHLLKRNDKIRQILMDSKIDEKTKEEILKELYYGI